MDLNRDSTFFNKNAKAIADWKKFWFEVEKALSEPPEDIFVLLLTSTWLTKVLVSTSENSLPK